MKLSTLGTRVKNHPTGESSVVFQRHWKETGSQHRPWNISASFTKREVTMAGYSPSPFYIFFERDKERGQYSAILTDQPWSIKDLSILPKRELFAGPTREIPSGKLGSQSERRILFILPTRRLSHLIKGFINWRSFYQMTLKQRRLWRTWLATGEQFPSKVDAMATVILLMRINEIS